MVQTIQNQAARRLCDFAPSFLSVVIISNCPPASAAASCCTVVALQPSRRVAWKVQGGGQQRHGAEHLLSRSGRIHHQSDIVALEKNASKSFPFSSLHINFFRIVQREIHIFVEANHDSFHARIGLLIQPDLHP